jgi:hypothetical protein
MKAVSHPAEDTDAIGYLTPTTGTTREVAVRRARADAASLAARGARRELPCVTIALR